MPTISGSLNLVTDRPVDSISEVWVRARETRGQGDGLTVGVNDRVPVTDGAIEFTALPGAAVLVLVQNGMPLETLPMLIGDEAQQSLRLVVQAGEVVGAADKSVIEQLVAEVAANTARAEQYRTEAAASASAAQSSESAATTSESKAKASETNAKASETNANAHRAAAAEQATAASESATQAAAARDAAKQSQSAAKTSETNAASHEQAAALSESNATVHETNAEESATAAAGSATEAASHADRAEVAADPDNLRDEVTQRFADLVDGAPQDLDTIREIAEYAQANRDITDQLNAAIGSKANKSHTHTTAQVDGLDAALAGKADVTHTHTLSQVAGLDAALARLAQAPELLQAIYPEQTTGAANASLVEVPPSWERSDVLLGIPPGWWHIKIETTSGAQSRFYTKSDEWIDYDGKLDAIIALKPGATQRFWGNMVGGTLSGKKITAVMQYIRPL